MKPPIRAVLFDLFGTLLDVHSVTVRLETFFPGHGARLSAAWRERQLDYTRLRSLGGQYVPFTQITDDALQVVCAAAGLPLDAATRGALMHQYTQLTPFADVQGALTALRERNLTLGVLSNGDPGLLEDCLYSAGLNNIFDLVLSVDEVRIYKPSPRAYELGTATLGHAANEIAFVSSNGWDAAGAAWFGYRTFWVNRSGATEERLGVDVEASGKSLAEVVEFVGSATKAG